MYRTAALLVTLLPGSALAIAPEGVEPNLSSIRQDGDDEGSGEDPGTLDEDEQPVADQPARTTDSGKPSTLAHPERGYDMEISFRGRRMGVPNSILDIWYFNEDDAGWAPSGVDRPDITAYVVGLEFVVKGEQANGIFYFDWSSSTMGTGYWDDREEPPNHLDGDFTEPSDNLGMLALGANYAYEAHFVRTANTKGAFGLSMLIGGGLGVGVVLGHIDRWGPGPTGVPGYTRYEDGDPPDGELDIPGVFPLVDINASLRFNFGDRVVMRVEGGLHTMLYYGATIGVMF